MQTGKLDQVITLKNPVTVNVGGQVEDTYTTVGNIWAEVIAQRGSEAFEAARVEAQRIIRVRVRYREDITVKSVIAWQDQEYNVTDVDRSSRREGALWFTAQVQEAT